MRYNPDLLPKVRSRKLLDAVRGMPCTLRIAGFAGKSCSAIETVVPCHVPTIGKGMGTKVSDLFVAAGCFTCHDLLDRRDIKGHEAMQRYPAAVLERILRGMCETQAMLIEKGIITVLNDEVRREA